MSATDFGAAVRAGHAAAGLVVQPRMGLADPAAMRAGLAATRDAAARTVGTITLDSYTRVGEHRAAARALHEGLDLNGYPLVAHGAEVTRRMVDGIAGDGFPVQVRHGSARPSEIVAAMRAARLYATEGGPVSYCLPYGRVSLDDALRDWNRACLMLAQCRELGVQPHLETFGGCMMGQLCPPSLLVALSVLEALYFRSLGLRSVSLSYAQQTNETQDREAVAALRRLCAELLSDIDCHIVIYAYMGVYPRTASGARALLASAVRLAVDCGAERLIVKTIAEAYRIPTVPENVEALELAAAEARRHSASKTLAIAPGSDETDSEVYQEARTLVDAVLELSPDPGRALLSAFKRGMLDVPYCLHPDNAGSARSYLDHDGRLRWASVGAMPLRRLVGPERREAMTAAGLLRALSHVQRSFDAGQLVRSRRALPV